MPLSQVPSTLRADDFEANEHPGALVSGSSHSNAEAMANDPELQKKIGCLRVRSATSVDE